MPDNALMSQAVIERTHHRAAAPTPTSFDREAMTCEVIFTTGADVKRQGLTGPYLERLSLEQGHCDLSKLTGGPVLNNHRQGDLHDQIGTVVKAWIESGQAIALIQFSRRPDLSPLIDDIEAGIIRKVSVGYSVSAWQDSTDSETGLPVRTATSWQPIEISFVTTPADYGATIRSKEPMPDMTTEPAKQEAAPLENRAEINGEIRSLTALVGLPADFANRHIDGGADLEQTRQAIFAELKTHSKPVIQTADIAFVQSHDDPAKVNARMGEALYCRATPTAKPSEAARPYMAMTSLDIAREVLTRNGISTTGLSHDGIITRAMGTSDFPVILGDSANRTLRAAYQAAPAIMRQLGRQTTAKDFRAQSRIQMDVPLDLSKVNEHGEYKHGYVSEAKESYKVDTFGRILSLSRQALVNDDLSAFADLTRRMGLAASAFEDQFLTDLLVGADGNGPVMDDGKSLFHADRGNLSGSPSGVGDSAIRSVYIAMQRRKGQGDNLIAATPKFMLVPPEEQAQALAQLGEVFPISAETYNPFAEALTLLVEPCLTDTKAWYVTADPALIDGLEYAYLEGNEGPQIFTREGFDTDSLDFKIRLDFGAGFVDWRGWYKNPGK